jgi:hypothetical protein
LALFQQLEPFPVASLVDRLDQAIGLRQNHERQNHWIRRKKNPPHHTLTIELA